MSLDPKDEHNIWTGVMIIGVIFILGAFVGNML